MKVCIFSDHHVAINPRLWKDAFFFERLGWDVTIVTMWISDEWREKDLKMLKGHRITYRNYFNLIPGEISSSKSFFFRLRKRLAAELVKTGIELPYALSYAPELMYDAVRKEKADLYIAHLECAFYVGQLLLKDGEKVAFDFEDWYSRDYLFPGRPKNLLKKLEAYALHNGIYCVAASRAMADALQKAYKSQSPPTVIYNGFSIDENAELPEKTNRRTDKPKLIWFSRNIGRDRGLETLFKALALLRTPVELHLLGKSDPGFTQVIKQNFPSTGGHTMVIHDFIEHRRLISFLSGFDIGLALEESSAESRQVTITNKILQYIQASLKVLATDTAGQKEVSEYFENKFKVVPAKNPAAWAAGIEELIARNAEEDVSETFRKVFSWESQQKKYLSLLQNKKIYGVHTTESN